MEKETNRYLNCCMPQCRGFRFNIVHKFPRSPERFDAWMEALQQPLLKQILNSKQTKGVFLCGRHFQPQDYLHAESRKLNMNAMPSLNIKDLSELQLCRKVESDAVVSTGSKVAAELAKRTEQKDNCFEEMERHTSAEHERAEEVTSSDVSNVKRSKLEQEVEEMLNNSDQEYVVDLPPVKTTPENCVDSSLLHSEKGDLNITLKGRILEIHHADFVETQQFDIFWLRQQCRCIDCVDSNTNMRKMAIFQTTVDLEPLMATLLEQTQELEIKWNSGHVSTYSIANLNLYSPFSAPTLSVKDTGMTYLLWSSKHTTFRDDFKAMIWQDLVCNETAVNTALDRLQRAGVLIIENIAAESAQLPILRELVVRRLMPHLPAQLSKETRTNFVPTHVLPHTNCTYEAVDCSLQILSLSASSVNAELTLVDGFNAAYHLQQANKCSFDFLTTYEQRLLYQYEKNVTYELQAPLIQVRQSNQLERINFAPYQCMHLPQNDFSKYTNAAQKFAQLMQSKPLQWHISLNAHMLIIVNNWRICWQVKAIENLSLDCIYITSKQYQSHMASLKANDVEFIS